MSVTVFTAQSLLFVSGYRADRLGKACDAGVGLADIDLQDTVPPLETAAGVQNLANLAEAGPPAIDAPFIDLDGAEGLADKTRRARALGFAAKAAIHPSQLPVIHSAFAPSPADVAEAQHALGVYDTGGEHAIRFRGRMLEAPVIRRNRAVLEIISRSKDEIHHA